MSTVLETNGYNAEGSSSNPNVCDAVYAVRSAPSILNDASSNMRQDREEDSSMPTTDLSASGFIDDSGDGSSALYGFGDDENGRRRSDRIRAKGKNIDYSQLFAAERFGLIGDRPPGGENSISACNGTDPNTTGTNADDEYDEALFDDDPHQRVFEELNLSDGEEEYKPELDDEAQTSEDELEDQVENEDVIDEKNKRTNSLYCMETAAGLIDLSSATSSSRFISSNMPTNSRNVRGGGRGRGRGGRGGVNESDKRVKRASTYQQPRRRGQPSTSLIKREQIEESANFTPCYGMWTPQTSADGTMINPYAYYAVPAPLQQQQPFASTSAGETSASSQQYQQFQPQYVSAGQMYPQYYAMPALQPTASGMLQSMPASSSSSSDPYGFCSAVSVLGTATKREVDEMPSESEFHFHGGGSGGLDDDNDGIGTGSSRAYAQTGPRKRRKRGGGAAGGGGPGADRSEHNRKERIRRAFITKRVLDCWQYVVAAAEQHGGGRDFTRYAPKLDKIRLVSFITAFLDAMKEQMDEFYGPQVWLSMQKIANQRALSLGDIDGNIGLLRELEAFDSETAKRMLKAMQLRAQLQPQAQQQSQPADTVQEAASSSTTILTTTEIMN